MFGLIEFLIEMIPAVMIAGAAVLGYVLLIRLFDDATSEEDGADSSRQWSADSREPREIEIEWERFENE